MYFTILVYLAWYSFSIKDSVFMPGLNFCVNVCRMACHSLGGVLLIMNVYTKVGWAGNNFQS